MTEEQKLKQSPGCGSAIILGLVAIVLLSLVGLIFPADILPYPNEILIGILIAAAIALVVAIRMWRSKKKDIQHEEDNKAENMLRHRIETLSHHDDKAVKLAEKYKASVDNPDSSESKESKESE